MSSSEKTRFVLWRGLHGWSAETSTIRLSPRGVTATGIQLGNTPLPYRLEYTLEAPDNWVTRSLHLEVTGAGWGRRLLLERASDGLWRFDADVSGEAGLEPPGGQTESLRGALDCDLAYSPLTNLMPVRRHDLHRAAGVVDFVMAWVSVPDLGFDASEQRYEHVRVEGSGSIVRFSTPSGFTSDLVLDADGLVRVYPQLAERVEATP